MKCSDRSRDETLLQLHPLMRMPYDSPLKHIARVAFHTPEMLAHYFHVPASAVQESVDSRLLRLVREKLDTVERDLGDVQQAIRESVKKYPPTTACLLSQENACVSAPFGQYSYSVCIFGEAKQDATRLGTWSKDTARDYKSNHTVVFTGGTTCWNGIQRSLVVEFACGVKEEIVALSEPSTCSYRAEMKSPCFCDEEYVASIEVPELRVCCWWWCCWCN